MLPVSRDVRGFVTLSRVSHRRHRYYALVQIIPTTAAPAYELLVLPVCGLRYGLTPDKFYKRSQEKNTSPVAGFFLGFQPTPFEQDCSGVPFRISGRWFIRAARLVFLASGFHRFCATKPVRSETTSSTVVRCQPWFYRGLMAQSFFGLSEGD